MIKVEKAKPEDFDEIQLHPMYSLFDPNAVARTSALWQKAYTVRSDKGEIIFILGWTTIWEGVVELWNLTTPLVEKYPKAYYSTISRMLKQPYPGIHRAQTVVYVGFDQAIRVNERLGFTNEGTLKAYGPTGYDFYMFGRVL